MINPSGSKPILVSLNQRSLVARVDPAQLAKREQLRGLAQDLNQALMPLMAQGKVRVTESGSGINIDINASALFAPGEARLDLAAVRSLSSVGRVLASSDVSIVVEGHTDNIPISTPQFPSNWELSASRAASVVRLFVDVAADPRRLSATGYADQRPIADNATSEGRQSNRRVAIMIESRAPDNRVEVSLLD